MSVLYLLTILCDECLGEAPAIESKVIPDGSGNFTRYRDANWKEPSRFWHKLEIHVRYQ